MQGEVQRAGGLPGADAGGEGSPEPVTLPWDWAWGQVITPWGFESGAQPSPFCLIHLAFHTYFLTVADLFGCIHPASSHGL